MVVGLDATHVVRIAVRQSFDELPTLGPDLVAASFWHPFVVQIDLFREESLEEIRSSSRLTGGLQKQDELLVQNVLVGLPESFDVIRDISSVVLDDKTRSTGSRAR